MNGSVDTKSTVSKPGNSPAQTTPRGTGTAASDSEKKDRICKCNQILLRKEYPTLTGDSFCPVCQAAGRKTLVRDHEADIPATLPAPPLFDYIPGPQALLEQMMEEDRNSIATLSIHKNRYEGFDDAKQRVEKWVRSEVPWLSVNEREQLAKQTVEQLHAVWETWTSFVIRVDYDENLSTVCTS